MKKLTLLSTFLFFTACAGSGGDGIFLEPASLAVDSTNSRVFVLENEGRLIAVDATNQDDIGDQPRISRKRNADIHDLLPSSPAHTAVYSDGTTSRLFISGAIANDEGNLVTNRITVLDFDGTTFSISGISPITVDDGNDGTTDTDDVLGDLVVDQANGLLYVSNVSNGNLFVYNTSDGTEDVAAIAIGGEPNQMSLDNDRLYIANTSTVEAEQVITVVNTVDNSLTEIDLDAPTSDVSVSTNDAGTIMLATQSSGGQKVFVRLVDTATYAASTAISAGDDSAQDGELVSGLGLTSTVGGVIVVSNGTSLFGYVGQADGDAAFISFANDLSSFTTTSLISSTSVLEQPVVYADGSTDAIVYMLATSSGDLVWVDAGDNGLDARF
ncbi:hypothetical protein K1X76_05905 [bacterium]|nr:hypothetical protein [bacterium]